MPGCHNTHTHTLAHNSWTITPARVLPGAQSTPHEGVLMPASATPSGITQVMPQGSQMAGNRHRQESHFAYAPKYHIILKQNRHMQNPLLASIKEYHNMAIQKYRTQNKSCKSLECSWELIKMCTYTFFMHLVPWYCVKMHTYTVFMSL